MRRISAGRERNGEWCCLESAGRSLYDEDDRSLKSSDSVLITVESSSAVRSMYDEEPRNSTSLDSNFSTAESKSVSAVTSTYDVEPKNAKSSVPDGESPIHSIAFGLGCAIDDYVNISGKLLIFLMGSERGSFEA